VKWQDRVVIYAFRTLITHSSIAENVIPVEYAVSTLAATIVFTVQLADPQHGSFSFTRTNDFIDHVIFVVQNSDIPGTVPG
jgi:hypothetical protein